MSGSSFATAISCRSSKPSTARNRMKCPTCIQARNAGCWNATNRPLKNYLRCHRGVKSRLKMLIYTS